MEVEVTFAPGEKCKKTRTLTQHDYGQYLEIHGLALPATLWVYFNANPNCYGKTLKAVASTVNDVTTVRIPDEMIKNDDCLWNYNVYACIFVFDETSGRTEYGLIIPVNATPRTDVIEELTEEERSELEQAIAAMNAALESKLDTTDIDETLTLTGKAADAKVVGDELERISSTIEELKENGTGTGSGTSWTSEQITLLETIGQYLVFTDASTGQIMFDNLITSLRNGSTDSGTDDDDSGNTGEDTGDTTSYTITNSLVNVTTDNNITSIDANSSYTANLTAESGYYIDSVVVTMGGVNVTDTVYADGVIAITEVTGNVVIVASGASTILYQLPQETVFDGATSIDTNVALLTRIGKESFTIVAEVSSVNSYPAFWVGDVTTLNYSLCHYVNNGKQIIKYGAGQYALTDWQSQPTIENKKMVVVYDGSTLKVYTVSDDSVSSETVTPSVSVTAFNSVDTTLKLGYTEQGNKYFTGTIHNFTIYNNVLTDDDINAYLGGNI